jgi:kynurenine formamidase
MNPSNLYRLSTSVEPFMQTQRRANGYTTSYAQIRIHHGTHVDFPPHVGYDGGPTWNLSGEGRIFDLATFEANYGGESVVLFDTGGEDLPENVVDRILD